jgi:hypothetical protein
MPCLGTTETIQRVGLLGLPNSLSPIFAEDGAVR